MNIKQFIYLAFLPVQLFGAAKSSINPYQLIKDSNLVPILACLRDEPKALLCVCDENRRTLLHGLVDRHGDDTECIIDAIEKATLKCPKRFKISLFKLCRMPGIVNENGNQLNAIEWAALSGNKSFLMSLIERRIAVGHTLAFSRSFDTDFQFYAYVAEHETTTKRRTILGKKSQLVLVDPWLPSSFVKKMIVCFKGRALEFLLSIGYDINTLLGDTPIIDSSEQTLKKFFKKQHPDESKLLFGSCQLHNTIFNYIQKKIAADEFEKDLANIRGSMSQSQFESLCFEKRLTLIAKKQLRILRPIDIALTFENVKVLQSLARFGVKLSPFIVKNPNFDDNIDMYETLIANERSVKVCSGSAGVFEPVSFTVDPWLPPYLVKKVLYSFGGEGARLLQQHGYYLGTSLVLLPDGSVDPQGETALDVLVELHPDDANKYLLSTVSCPIQ